MAPSLVTFEFDRTGEPADTRFEVPTQELLIQNFIGTVRISINLGEA